MSGVPNAWDDDWETIANKASTQSRAAVKPATKSERRAKHAETNRQLWEAAEQPERSFFVETKNEVPLKEDFKPQVKVLSRKPQAAPKIASRGDAAASGVANLSIEDDEDSEEEARRRDAETFAERQRKAAAEREEKQRKYAEVRERLFGSSDASQVGSSGSAKGSPSGRDSRQGSRRGRGGGGAVRGSQPGSSAEQSPARATGQAKQLFDPNLATRPAGVASPISRSSTPREEQPIRQPRGPDLTNRGGFAASFAQRGGKAGV